MFEWKEQSWVTSACDEDECFAALVLCRSLRRVFTTRKITLLITPNLPTQLRDVLESEFNVVIEIPYNIEHKSVSWNNLAKVSTWKLTMFKKCVFIPSECLVLENCDEFFDQPDFAAGANSFVFVCVPSFSTYNKLSMGFFNSTNGTNQDFTKHFLAQSASRNISGKVRPATLEAVLTESISLEMLLSNNPKIIRFEGTKPWMASSAHGQHCYTKFCQMWVTIFKEDLAQSFNSNTNLPENIKKILLSGGLPCATTFISKEYNEHLSGAVAVVGLSCRFPGANNPQEFWDLLVNGRDAIRPVPPGRWDTKDIDLNEEDLRKTQAGFLKCAIDEFDAKFYGISPREATFMDPQQRILLEVAWESLENAGINPLTLKGSDAGVFVGVWTADYEALLRKNTTGGNAHRVYLGNAYSATSARISFFLGLNGPNIATESGCSSSFVSLHLACESLRKGECNLTLAGGVNLLLHPYSLVGTEKPYFMAADGHCKTFDAKADGFGRAEGCGMVVLKRFADAIRDGDNILGVIRGSAVNMEGTTASFGTPSKNCQEIVIREALKSAHVDPEKISYVEAHGTGTMVGDPIEISAMVDSYSKDRREPLLIGSVKTNIGHTEGAAGVAGLIKVLLALKNDTVPPHCNFETLNPDIPLEKIPAEIPMMARNWEKVNGGGRIAAVSSFSISGTNVHVIIEDPPVTTKILNAIQETDRPLHLLTLSAKNERALTESVGRYQEFFKANQGIPFSDVAYTTNVGRAHFSNRVAVVGDNVENVGKQLISKNFTVSGKRAMNKEKLAFLFTGQGSQYVGMGKQLYKTNICFKMAIDRCENILNTNLGISILEEIFKDENMTSNLDQTIFSQTSIFCIEYGLFQLWNSFGVKPDFVFGHSVGEFAAATAAGIISLEDALQLVSKRSQLIQGLPSGGMLAIKTSLENVQALQQRFKFSNGDSLWVDIAVVNSSEEIVVAGRPATLELFNEFCTKENIKTQKVAASHAFHSRDMENILESFRIVAQAQTYENPKCGYVSGRDGRLLQDTNMNADYWLNHARDTVNFPMALKTLYNSDCRVFVEIGPHPILLALALNNLSVEESMECLWLPTIRRNEQEWQTVLSTAGKLYVNGFDLDFNKFWTTPHNHRRKIELPTYPFQRKRFWFESISEANSLSCNTKALHPLLGKHVPVAIQDMSVNIYQQNLALHNAPYLADHVVGGRIIMPGAGFLEIILAAANLAIQGDRDAFSDSGKAFCVEDFVIEAPLELIHDRPCRLQTVVCPQSLENNELLKVTIFKKSDSTLNPWKRHACAKVKTSISGVPDEWQKNQLREIKGRCTEVTPTEELYTKVAEVGITFGATFKSITEFWKGEKEVLAEVFAPPSFYGNSDRREYICHPVAIDAMLQAYAFQIDFEKVSLYLPVAIEKFTWLSKKVTAKLYLYILWEEHAENKRRGTVKLLNEAGDCLCVMQGVRLVKTTLEAFINFLNAQKRETPGLLHEVFRPRIGPLMSRLQLHDLAQPELILENLSDLFNTIREAHSHSKKVAAIAQRIVRYRFMNTLYELGWNPAVGKIFDKREVMTDLLISFRHEKYLQRIFSVFAEDGYLEFISSPGALKRSQWKVKILPPKEEILDLIEREEKELIAESPNFPIELPIIRRCFRYLSGVLQDKEVALSVLFVEDPAEENAARIYTDSDYCVSANKAIGAICENIFSGSTLPKDKSGGSGVVRILEIGGGTGSTTEYVFAAFKKINLPFSYTFTDISPTLLSQTKQKFKDVARVSYKVLNIELDPKAQGFAPNYHDLVVCSNVIHATADLTESMRNIRHLVAPGGYFVMMEMFKPIRHIDMIFGMLDGYWRFKDTNLRPQHPLIDIDKWVKVAELAGFVTTTGVYTWGDKLGVLVCKASPKPVAYEKMVGNGGSVWLIFGSTTCPLTAKITENFRRDAMETLIVGMGEKFSVMGNNHYELNPAIPENFISLFENIASRKFTLEGVIYFWTVGAEEKDQDAIVGGLLYFSQCMLKYILKSFPKLFIVSQGIYYTGDEEPSNPTAALARGLMLSLKSEQPGLRVCFMDFDKSEEDVETTVAEIYDEIWTNDCETQVALRQRKRFVKRLVACESPPAPLVIPNSERFTLVMPETNAVADLVLAPLGSRSLADNELEICIKATGLNFRDLFVILKPDMFQSLYWEIGLEFSGIVTAVGSKVTQYIVGEAVLGFTLEGGIRSHTVTREDLLLKKPANITHAEAATMPTVFFTAYASLISIAKISEKDTVLIHVASGGVGLAALQICRQLGAKVIATAGSRRKRAHLRSLGIQHVFHSRNTNYGEEIIAVTNGEGVDVVLNSLTGPNFKETSLKICKPHARFVEMSKINIWTVEEVKKLREDVSYTIINLEKDIEKLDGTKEINRCISEGKFKPLPYTQFDVTRVKEAFEYFQKAHHIGKVVITFPTVQYSKGTLTIKEHMFNEDSTYLVTGGLGGIGLEVAKFMSRSGAKNIVLIARSAPSPAAEDTIKSLTSKGINVITRQVDVGNYKSLDEMLESLKNYRKLNLPPLRGVMHAAGFISDGMITNQTMEKFRLVFNAKVRGVWNLHHLTRGCNLEHFIIFSSAAALLGPMGQPNHAAANSFLDTFAHYRHALGLPVQTINWGIWSEVGVAAELALAKDGAFGIRPFSPTQGLAALKVIMKYRYLQTAVTDIDMSQFKQDPLKLGTYIEELTAKSDTEVSAELLAEGDKMWKEIKETAPDKRADVIKVHIEGMIRQTLKLPGDEPLDENQNFSDMGLDSLMAVEMRNKLQLVFGKNLTLNTTALLDNPNIRALSDYLAQLITAAENSNGIVVVKTNTEEISVSDLVAQDSILPEYIKTTTKAVPLAEIKNILLTGVTGQLGIYILSSLRRNFNVRVVCLIRARSDVEAAKKLRQKLKKNCLEQLTDLRNVECVTGNVTKDQLGLGKEKYDELSSTVDAVIHCAVLANHVHKYSANKSMEGYDIRSVNVFGTINILKFAANTKTKHVLQASSLVAISKVNENGFLTEELPEDTDFGENITWGYARSKFIGEKLVKQAIERGVPCKILRFPTIVGNSETGMFFPETNHLMLFLLGCMHLGKAPEVPGAWSSIAVDTAAQIAVNLFLTCGNSAGNNNDCVYNITNPFVTNQAEMHKVLSIRGHPLEIVSMEAWSRTLAEMGEDSLLHSFSDIYLEKGFATFINSCPFGDAVKAGDKAAGNMFALSEKLKDTLPGVEESIGKSVAILEKHLDYAEATGIYKMFNINK